MPEEMVYGIRITGDPGGGISAVNQVLSAFQKLDAKLKGMANRTIGATTTPLGNIDQLGGAKDVAAWQNRQELELARQRMAYAKQHYDTLKKAADDYYAKLVTQEQKVAAIQQKLTDARANGKGTTRLEQSLATQTQKLNGMKAEYAKKYQTAVNKAEQSMFTTAVAYARKLTQIVKQEKQAQEQASKKSADAQIQHQKRINAEAQRAIQNVGKGWQQGINSFIAAIGSGGNAVRLISQGFSELGRVLTTFVAIPLGGFFMMSFRTAIDFESAMVRVGKTTGLEGEKLQNLTQWIRDFSKTTVSSHVELATFAEQLGQIGVVDTNAMSRLIATVEMMASATELSADNVTKSLGRIATAFGYDLNTEKGVRAIEKLSNTINKLENTTAASAGEIIDGLLNVAAAGGMLNIPVQDMAAIVSMMESMGVASDAVGNRISRFYQQLISKSSDAAKFMKGFTTEVVKDGEKVKRTYSGDQNEFMAWLNEDKVQVLNDFMSALNNVPDQQKTEAMAQWFDLVGQVGGKVGVMAGNVKGLGEALNNARQEFESGNSLFQEYDKALMTTEAHMKILRNNINDAAITVGDAFLPVINRLIEYAIPGIQMLAAAFKSLSWENKLLVVGIPILVTVLAPILFIVSQLVHAFGMLFMGFQTFMVLARNVGMAFFGVGKLIVNLVGFFRLLAGGATVAGGAIAGSLAPALSTLAAILAGVALGTGAVYLLLRSLQKSGVDIAGFFHGLAQRARAWGENLMLTYADGLLGGAAKYITQAIAAIAEWIASFFEAHSPPEQGPLSDIDKWGGPLFSTYLRGFMNADFGILEDVGNTVRSILQNMFSGDDADVTVNKMVASARVALAELISVFNKTGEISKGLLDKIAAGTGHLTDDVKKLVVLWLQYEKTQKRIKDLEKARQDVEKGYEDEVARIAASNLSATEKADRIRAAMMKKNSAVDTIEKEKKAEEDKAEALKEQLDWQKEFIKAQVDQADIFAKIAKALDKMGGALENLGNLDFGKLGGGGGPDPVKPFEDMKTKIQERIDGAREVVRSFFRGLKGDLLDTEKIKLLPPDLQAEIQKAYEWGKKLYDIFHPKPQAGGQGDGTEIPIVAALKATAEGIAKAVSEAWNQIVEVVSNNPDVQQAVKTLQELADLLFSPKAQSDLEGAKKGWQQFGYGFGLVIGVILKLLATLVIILAWVINLPIHLQEVNQFFTEVGQAIGRLGEEIPKFFDQVGKSAQEWLAQKGEEIGKVLEGVKKDIAAYFENLAMEALEWGENLIKQYGEGLLSGAGKWLSEKAAQAAQAIADFFEPHSPPKEGPLSTIDTWGGKLLSLLLDGFLNGDFNPLAKIGEKLRESITNIFGGGAKGAGQALNLVGVVTGMLDDMVGVFAQKIPELAAKWEAIKSQPTTILGDLGSTVITPIFNTVWSLITTWFNTNTPIMEQNWIRFRDTFIRTFQLLPQMVATVFTALFYQPEVVSALGIAYGQFEQAGRNFAGSVGKGIESVSSNVIGSMSALVQGLIAQIDIALASVYSLIDALNELNNTSVPAFATGGAGGGGGGGKGNGKNSGTSDNGKRKNGGAVALASGGIAMAPTLALIAEAKQPEAVIPLNKLPNLVSSMMPAPENTQVVIQINNPNFKSDNDMRKLVREVKRDLTSTLRDQKRMKGRS